MTIVRTYEHGGTTQVSCLVENGNPAYPGDSYDINATLLLSDPADWFSGLAAGDVSLVLAPGATCAGITSGGLPGNAVSINLPAATITRTSDGTAALSEAAIPVAVQSTSNQTPPGNVNFELQRDGFVTHALQLRLTGNAVLCNVTSLAVMLTDNDNDADNAIPGSSSDSVCLDIPNPALSEFSDNNFLIHACIVSANP